MSEEDYKIITQLIIELFNKFNYKCETTHSIDLLRFRRSGSKDVIYCHIYSDYVGCNWYKDWTKRSKNENDHLRLVLFLADFDNQRKVNEFVQQIQSQS